MNLHLFLLTIVLLAIASTCLAEENKVEWYSGADISMLPELEKGGAVYRESGNAGDAIKILGRNGCNLFRLRLFVNPSTDFNKTWGATQGLKTVLALSRRIKNDGGKILLDLHYSDSWADPKHQSTPADWKEFTHAELVRKVHDYTLDVLNELKKQGVSPDMIQIGNEIASGILWPTGQVYDVPQEQEKEHWNQFAEYLKSGIAAAREFEPDSSKLKIMLHVHGGGQQGVPTWFFSRMKDYNLDFDLIGLSFYPVSGESIDVLKLNITRLIETFNKNVIIAEVSYPWKQVDYAEKHKDTATWAFTPEGQKQFLSDLKTMLVNQPNHRAVGFIWWYPEAHKAGNLFVWRGGAEALFDDKGNALPAMKIYGAK